MEHQRIHTVELGKWPAGRWVGGGSNFSDEARRLQNLYMVAHFKRYLLEQNGNDQLLTASHAADNEPAIAFVAK